MKLFIGIISYLPNQQIASLQRQERLLRLIDQLNSLFPKEEVIIIAQNWKAFTIKQSNIHLIHKDKMGILRARRFLRQQLLKTNGDYFMLFDDDAIINAPKGSIEAYKDLMRKNPQGFAFIHGTTNKYNPYADSQLNLCAISRYILEKEDLPWVDPQVSQGFEDRIYSSLLHYKYGEHEFNPPEGLHCSHFKNPNEVAPSTWSQEKRYNWKFMRANTLTIEEYIVQHKDLPEQYRKIYKDGE